MGSIGVFGLTSVDSAAAASSSPASAVLSMDSFCLEVAADVAGDDVAVDVLGLSSAAAT